MKIRRKCKCGCGKITKLGNKYIHGHHRKDTKASVETKLKQSISAMGNTNGEGCKGKRKSEEHKKKISRAQIGNTNTLGYKQSEGHILKRSISNIKYDPDYEYCDMWKDGEYRGDLRKDYCENVNCKGDYKQLGNHHIDLNKKNCHPSNIMTLCQRCHMVLHRELGFNVDLKDFIIIRREDHISYINKRTRKKIIIKRIIIDEIS